MRHGCGGDALWISRDICNPGLVQENQVKDMLKYVVQWVENFQRGERKQVAVKNRNDFFGSNSCFKRWHHRR